MQYAQTWSTYLMKLGVSRHRRTQDFTGGSQDRIGKFLKGGQARWSVGQIEVHQWGPGVKPL